MTGVQTCALPIYAFAHQSARDATYRALHAHGGYGFMMEYDIQLYFRRAKALELTWWDTRYLEELVATSLVDGLSPHH